MSVDGVRSPVLEAGPADASEAVVFVHGNPGAGSDFADLLGRVGGFARAVAPDMPGFGNADRPRRFEHTNAGYARHLVGVLAQLGIRRAHLVAHDFGGAWGLVWAAEHPDAFASATLINTLVLIEYRWHRFARIWRTPGLGEALMAISSRRLFRALVGRENPRLSRRSLDRLYEQFEHPDTRRAVLRLYRATPPDALEPLAEPLRSLDRPALIVWGTEDAYIPAAQAERARRAFPSARVELLDGLGHWPLFEDPDRVAALVVPFLRERATRPGDAAAVERRASRGG